MRRYIFRCTLEKLNELWSFEEVHHPKTGDSYNNYYYKNDLAHRVVVDTPKSRVLSSYIAIEKDLRSATFWLESIIELYKVDEEYENAKSCLFNKTNRGTHNLAKGLFVSSLTFYGKCFGKSEGRSTKLEKKNLPERLYEHHDLVMKYRHNFAAHSGAEMVERTRIVTALDPKRKAKPYLAWELNQPDTFDLNTIREFIELFEYNRKFAISKREMLLIKVYNDDVLGKGMKYWYKKL